MITHASTFSGIGAPEVAAEMLGWENVFHCEINPFGRRVLDYYFPKAKSYEDITRTDFSEWRDRITVLTGGFPCQPFSYAGRRRGSEDDRYLWPFMLRCIEHVRPRWFVGENVAGITTMAFPGEDVKVGEQTDLFGACDEVYEKHERYVLDEICQSLERAGYSVQPMLIPACAVGAPHRRDRVFIVAHRLTEDTLHSGLMGREHDEQGCERNIGDAGARGAERVCGEPMAGTIADTDRSNNGTGRPEEPTSTMRCEGVQERNAVQQSEQSTEVRPTMGRPTPDPSCSGSGAQAESDRLISEWRDRLSLASQRGDSPQRTDGLSALQGHTSYTPSESRKRLYERPSAGAESALASDTIGNGRTEGRDELQFANASQEQDGGGIGKGIVGNASRIIRKEEDRQWLLPENRWRCFPSVSPVYRGNDGLPFPVDHLTIPFSEWKRESLKAYGNAIVPQVMYEIFRCIDEIEKTLKPK